jgi:hypothetical protein
LTLDYGMRFTIVMPYWQADRRAVNFDPLKFDPSKQIKFFQPALNAQGARVARNPVTGETLPLVFLGAIKLRSAMRTEPFS